MRFAAALFDLDGTLVDSRRLYLECYRRALAPHLGRELTDEEMLALRPRGELRILPEQVPGPALDACLDEFYRHYRDLHQALFGGVFEGVPEMLAVLRAAGCRTGIVTGKSRRAWEISAGHAALGPFDVFILDDDVAAEKPDPEGILDALGRLHVDPAHALYVGDTVGDLLAARAAGVLAVAALWGKRKPQDRERFEQRARAEGAVLLDRPEDVVQLVAGQTNR